MSQKRITKQKSWEKEAQAKAAAKTAEEEKGLKEETDELLDEIDTLLEEQAVLVNFRQRGGQ